MAQFVAATAAMMTGQDPSVAAMTAGTSARENALAIYPVLKSGHRVLSAFNEEERQTALEECSQLLAEEFFISATPEKIEAILTAPDKTLMPISGGHDTRMLYRDIRRFITGAVESVTGTGESTADFFEYGTSQLIESELAQHASRYFGNSVGLLAGCFIAASGKLPKASTGTKLLSSRFAGFEGMRMRKVPGVATVSKPLVDRPKLLHGTSGNAGFVPKEIGDKLVAREFKSFDHFRGEFWKTVAESKYKGEFGIGDIKRMSSGLAPFAPMSQRVSGAAKYQLHHAQPIQHGGGVYDIGNMQVVTPKVHQQVLAGEYHYGKSN
ncbi:HNH endonuclease [Alphaproteobacteria bacterium]|nr:HNH endonuclease [Alphaproteobacteria bacterium]